MQYIFQKKPKRKSFLLKNFYIKSEIQLIILESIFNKPDHKMQKHGFFNVLFDYPLYGFKIETSLKKRLFEWNLAIRHISATRPN